MPRPVISVDTIGRLQRTARSHESLADHLNTDEQLLLVLDRHDDLQQQVERLESELRRARQQLDDRADRQATGDPLVGISTDDPTPADVSALLDRQY